MSQAGSFAPSGGGGSNITINGDTGSATGSTIDLKALNGAIGPSNCGATVLFVASGSEVDLTVSDASLNTFIGQDCGTVGNGFACTAVGVLAGRNIGAASSSNCFFGYGAGNGVVNANNIALGQTALFGTVTPMTGSGNIAIGLATLGVIVGASDNVSVGNNSLQNLVDGLNNLTIGHLSGDSYTTTESNNILISNIGVLGESNVMRIGTSGNGASQVNKCYVAGIDGVAIVGAAVLCATDGQLGDVVSSEKYKENIEDVSKTSYSILNCRPVSFSYKSDKSKTKCFGLIAEEVEKVFPDLVLYKDGEVYSIRYHEIPSLLIAEMQKLKYEIEVLRKVNNLR